MGKGENDIQDRSGCVKTEVSTVDELDPVKVCVIPF